MSNRATIELLIGSLATSREQGWDWIVALHEGGFELRMGANLPYFSDPNLTEFIQPGLTQGAVTWTAGGYQYTGTSPTFADPMAALVWWNIQKSNKGQADSGWDDGIPKAPPAVSRVAPPRIPWDQIGATVGQPMSAPAQAHLQAPSIQPFLKDVPFP